MRRNKKGNKEKGPDTRNPEHPALPFLSDKTHPDISNTKQFPNEARISRKILKILDKIT